MKLYELIEVMCDQDEIELIFPDNNVGSTYRKLTDIPITYANYRVTKVYGYDASGYDGIEISIVED